MKAKTDLYCPTCGTKIYEKDEELIHIAPFTGNEERCNQCDTILRRRSPGGQSDLWKFVLEGKKMSERWDASTYVADWKDVFGVIQEFFPTFEKALDFDEEDLVLEVGVGSGKWSAAFAILGHHCVVVDNNPEMFEQVRKNFPAISKSFIFVLDDARTLNRVPNNTFNIVFSEGLLEHFLDKEERLSVLRAMAKKVRQQLGILIILVPYKTNAPDEHQYEDVEELFSEFKESGMFEDDYTGIKFFSEGEELKIIGVMAIRA